MNKEIAISMLGFVGVVLVGVDIGSALAVGDVIKLSGETIAFLGGMGGAALAFLDPKS